MQTQARISRRAFLAVATAGAALGAGAMVVSSRLGAAEYPSSRWATLSDRVAAVLTALGDLWLPASGGDFPLPAQVPVLDNLASLWGDMPAHLVPQVNLGVEAFEVAALVYGWHGHLFTRLSAAGQHAYVQRWANGATTQRALVMALRQLVLVSYWQDPSTWPATGYPGPLHQRAELPALGDAPEPSRT